jgi:hypothetical protein
MDLTDKEHGLVKRHDMGYTEPGYVADMTERNINEGNGENNKETWAMVVSRRNQEGKSNGQKRKEDLQITEGMGIEKEVGEKRHDLSPRQQMIKRVSNQARYQREYKKEATLTMTVKDIDNITIIMIIKAVEDKVGIGKLIGLRRKSNNEFEMTLGSEMDCDLLLNGIMINGQECEMRKLCATERMVSFLSLPSYIEDDEISQKLINWGVTPILPLRRRYHPGTTVADGTRFLRVKFTQEVTSLPYNTSFMTEEGVQYFRVIHDNQVKTCRICASPEHEKKDCPQFLCRNCLKQGHYARECKVPRCQGCQKTMLRCRCERNDEENEDTGMEIQEVMGVTTIERLNDSQRQTQGEEDKQDEEEEENTKIDENEEKNEDGEQGMEMGGGAKKEDVNLIDFSKEQDDVDTNGLDYGKGQGKEKAEEKGIKILTEVRGADNGRGGMENKGKERLNRGVKAKKGGLDIQQVLKKQKIRRGELKEMLERRKK